MSLIWIVNILSVFFLCVFFAGIVIPQILLIAFRRRLFDEPDERKIHQCVVPRLGGMAFKPVVFFSFVLLLAVNVSTGHDELLTEQGIVTANYQTGHPHGYISAMYRGELAISKILYANDENFYEFKKQAERYPTALQKGLTEFFMFEAGFSLMFAENNIDKDDVSYVCGHCFRSISSLNQVLFAVNKEYCINEKKAVKMIEDFKIKPSDYKERVDKVISLISTNVDCTRKGIEILQRLVNEVEYLKGAHIQ